MFLPGDDNTNAIQRLISNSNKLDCAVAFLGQKADRILAETNSGGRIICNLSSGGTNPFVIKQLLDKGSFAIKKHPFLHAKVYIGNNEVIVSSANFSANGLGLEAEELSGWLEAGYQVTDQKELKSIQKWFSNLWDNSTDITPDDITVAMEAWKKRQINRPSNSAQKSLLQELRDNPKMLQNRNIYLAIYSDLMSTEAEKTLNKIKKDKKLGVNVDAYENWDDLPENSYYIDLFVGPRKGVKYAGIFKTPEKKILINFEDEDREKNTLCLCHKKDNCFGYVLSKEDQNLLKNKAVELLESDLSFGDSDAKFIPLMDARNILFARCSPFQD
ncbi:MAG: phospholipase D family protein [Geobacteraceae bacterium]|nr:phospholipase D family protein [Geobacteraceae bacterium]